jgi:hypothetical protein
MMNAFCTSVNLDAFIASRPPPSQEKRLESFILLKY